MPIEKNGQALIVGASGGIGNALADVLSSAPWSMRVIRVSRTTKPAIDLTDEDSIRSAVQSLEPQGPFDLIVTATGMLHDDLHSVRPEKTWRAIDPDTLAHSFAVNAIGPALIAKHFLPHLNRSAKTPIVAALSARVGSISDNRLGGWYGYRASKAALNQIIRCLGIELARSRGNAICVGLHPGTVDTRLSKPFQANAKDVFLPQTSADHLVSVLDSLSPMNSGRIFDWRGEEIDP